MERRCQPQNAGTWYETRRIIFQIIGVYTVLLLGVIVWQVWVVTHGLQCARFLEFSAAFWVLTVIVLVVIRRVVVVNFVRSLRRRAGYDALTGVYRPEVFWQRADVLTRTLTACGRLWAFVYLDLADFKQVNDSAGHFTGHAVLRTFGALLKAHGRQESIVGRLGGEEFGWVLSGCTTEEAAHAANRLLAAF